MILFFLSHYQKILQELDVLHTVSVVVALRLRTVVGGILHLTATLDGNVFVVRSQHEQSLLYVFVWAGLVAVHCHGSVVVMVLVQATKFSGADAGVASSEQVDEGLQLVTVVVSGSIGAGVGQIIMQWMPVVTDVREQPIRVTNLAQRDAGDLTDLGSR